MKIGASETIYTDEMLTKIVERAMAVDQNNDGFIDYSEYRGGQK
jgi:hypothetical protein